MMDVLEQKPSTHESQSGLAPRALTLLRSSSGGVLVMSLALLLVCFAVAPGTLQAGSLYSMLPLAGALAIAAAGQTLVVQQRGFDISVPATMSVTAYVCCRSVAAGHPFLLTIVLCAAVVVVIGLVNGFLVTRLAITPLIATLATNALATGAVWTISNGLPVKAPDGLGEFVRAAPLGIPVVALIAIAVVAALQTFQSQFTRGQEFLACGASPRVGRAAGLIPARYELAAYVGSAACAGVAGIVLAGYAGAANNTLGDPYLLPAVAAVIIGGTPLTGGAGNIVATGLAALFLTQLVQLTLALGAPTSSQLLVQCVAIVLAVLLRTLLRNRSRDSD